MSIVVFCLEYLLHFEYYDRLYIRVGINMKTAKNRSGKGILVIDIDDENQTSPDDFIKICGKCEKVCQTCNENLCKFCIIDHYKNPDFTKDHEMIPI